MINEHIPNCDCYECNLDKSVVGKYVRSKKPVIIYNKMGGTVFRTARADRMIGRVKAVNSKGNWLYISDPYAGGEERFVNVTPDLTFSTPVELTPEQKKDVILQAIKSTTAASGAGGALSVGAGEVAVETSKQVLNFLPKLKWIIIGVIVLLTLTLIAKIKA